MVNTIIHDHVRLKKTESEMAGDGISGGRCLLSKESDNTLYWYCGAAVCRIRLRKETLPEKTDGEICQNSGNWLWSRSWKFDSNL